MPGDLGQAAGAASLPPHPATPSHTRPAPSLPLRGPLCLPLAPAPSPLLHHPSSSPHSAVSSSSSTPDVLVPRGVLAPARPPAAASPAAPALRVPLGLRWAPAATRGPPATRPSPGNASTTRRGSGTGITDNPVCTARSRTGVPTPGAPYTGAADSN